MIDEQKMNEMVSNTDFSVKKLSPKPGDFLVFSLNSTPNLSSQVIESFAKYANSILPEGVKAIFILDGDASIHSSASLRKLIDEQEKKNASQNG